MENKYQAQVLKIQKSEKLYVAFCKGTRMPFITCDKDTYNDQIWLFTTEEKAKDFAAKRRESNQDVLMVVVLEQKQLLGFFGSLYAIGINEVVFTDEDMEDQIPLEKIVMKPDYSKLSPERRPLTNPQMQLTGLTFMQELHRQLPHNEKPKLRELEEEMLANMMRSKFLVALEVQGEKAAKDNSNVKIPCVKNKEGKMYQPLFTDMAEFAKFNAQKKFTPSILEFPNVEKIIGENVEGITVNPQGMNVVILKNKLPDMLQRFSK